MSSPPSAVDRSTPLLQQRIRELFRRLPKALAGEVEAVHQMRIAGRRLRVALPVLARRPEGRRARDAGRILRQLARAAGSSRDLDVGLELFDGHLAPSRAATASQRTLRSRLRGARTRSRARMAEALLDIEIARLRRDLRRIVARRGEVLFTVVLRLRDAREARGARVVEALGALGDRYDPAALHELRKRVRRLRYVAEVAEAVMAQSTAAPAAFKALQEQLGRIRDRFVLSEWLGRQAASARARGQEALAVEAAEMQRSFLAASQAEHRAFLERSPAERVREGLLAMGPTRSSAA
ncbi:MAG TPA: CHAD domain-containing protein [Vicinamibacteria bacterium]|nr:CHAD domain-containing protein [Vicinamibacteria bacterium]